MKKLKVLIADDEQAAVDVIRELLTQFAPEAELAGIAMNGLEAIQIISREQPDIVFLDVDMPVRNGLMVLEKFPNRSFKVIFTTGSERHALDALKLQAIDYLLKPIDPADFIIAMDKARNALKIGSEKATPAETATKIQLATQEGIIFLEEAHILYITAKGSYCQIHTTNGEVITISRNIGHLEKRLAPEKFIRCHNSYLVNLDFISRFYHKNGFSVEMTNGTIIEVSRRCKDKLLETLAERSK